MTTSEHRLLYVFHFYFYFCSSSTSKILTKMDAISLFLVLQLNWCGIFAVLMHLLRPIMRPGKGSEY